MRSGTHGLSVGMVMCTGVPSPSCLAALAGGVGVEDRGQEDRTALGVEVEHLGRIRRQAEAVLVAHRPTSSPPPLSTVRSSASILVSSSTSTPCRVGRDGRGRERATRLRWLRFADQSLQRPVAALLDVVGTPGSGMSVPNWPPPPGNLNAVT